MGMLDKRISLFKRDDCLSFRNGTSRQHLGNGLAQDGMSPIGRHLCQRHENECAVLDPGMRQDEVSWCTAALLALRESHPGGLGGNIRVNNRIATDHIDIKRSGPPSLAALAPRF